MAINYVDYTFIDGAELIIKLIREKDTKNESICLEDLRVALRESKIWNYLTFSENEDTFYAEANQIIRACFAKLEKVFKITVRPNDNPILVIDWENRKVYEIKIHKDAKNNEKNK